MMIACIGWGSLVWDPLPLQCKGGWQPDGPILPLEFARTSLDGRLTLVLTAGAVPISSLWTELDYASAGEAKEALMLRENSKFPAVVGTWPGPPPRHAVGADAIAAWAAKRGMDAVLWTALGPKFGGQNGVAPENAAAAVAYLQGLDGDAAARAKEYITQAPAQVRTAFRVAFEAELGWLPV